ncbi:type II toxin-antitoxin system VapC family toxin [Mesorhizobium sp. BAC0120]|uniref:type II toxin-antitoxin system VapC family toxin n=1 Tax=Mesorhizobium sp. BAC0120 TaxID=3090670 RepID=UPI00298CF24F|nr:type II toxin-antitoxin system VapC family toxin [Mesorhizobium sp. BAC0120]MDW6024474.1 type II toxin-antitoxin system VapC family toxin [Mesorhizobium sp. BAC0120]
MIVDTSALTRLFLAEPGYEEFDRVIADRPFVLIPLSCFVEFGLLHRLGPQRMAWLDAFSVRGGVAVAGIEPEQREMAVMAARKYGKGSGHRAQLNFGDCLVYAVAKYREMPLLFSGEDFRHTDITPALA